MSQFRYEGVNAQGEKVASIVEASSVGDAVAQLEQQGITIASIQRVNGEAESPPSAEAPSRKLSSLMEEIVANRTMLAEALNAYSEEFAAGPTRRGLHRVALKLQETNNVASLLGRDPATDQWLSSLASGMAVGDAMQFLPSFVSEIQQADRIRRQIVVSYAYPTVVALLTFAVFVTFSRWAAPVMEEMLYSFFTPQGLPLVTQVTLTAAFWARNYAVASIAALVVVAVALYFFARTWAQNDAFDRRLGWITGGSLGKVAAAGGFARRIAGLLGAGLAPAESVGLAGAASPYVALRRGATELAAHLEKEDSQAAAFAGRQRLPAAVIAVLDDEGLAVSGRAAVLNHVANAYRERTEDRLMHNWGGSAPIAVLLIGFIIGLGVVSLFLPLFQLVQGLQL